MVHESTSIDDVWREQARAETLRAYVETLALCEQVKLNSPEMSEASNVATRAAMFAQAKILKLTRG